MPNPNVVNPDILRRNVVVLANANELLAQLVGEVCGGDVADSINGSMLTNESIKAMAQTRFMNNIRDSFLKGKK